MKKKNHKKKKILLIMNYNYLNWNETGIPLEEKNFKILFQIKLIFAL